MTNATLVVIGGLGKPRACNFTLPPGYAYKFLHVYIGIPNLPGFPYMYAHPFNSILNNLYFLHGELNLGGSKINHQGDNAL